MTDGTRMIGIGSLISAGGMPWAGGESRSFARSEIVALGKLRCHGDFVTRFLVRLADGTELFVKATEQPKDDARWIRKLARRHVHELAAGAYPSRDTPFVISWRKI